MTPPSEDTPGSLPLQLESWENFAQAIVIDHLSYYRAYLLHVLTSGSKPDWDSVCPRATRLAKDHQVKARIAYLRACLGATIEEELGITAKYLAAKHQEILETPVGSINHQHPLAQKVRRRRLITGNSEETIQEWIVEEIEMPGKASALKALAELGGHNAAQKIEQTNRNETSADDLTSNPAGCHAVGRLLAGFPECAEAMRAGLEGREISPKPTP